MIQLMGALLLMWVLAPLGMWGILVVGLLALVLAAQEPDF